MSTLLVSVGLGIDVVGAGIIALPDIPQVRKYHRAGRMRNALKLLNLGGLPAMGTASEELQDKIEKIVEEPIPDDTRLITVEVSHNHEAHGTVRKLKAVTEDDERHELAGYPYQVIHLFLEQQIRKREAFYRGIGFLVLALGFTLQICGQLV